MEVATTPRDTKIVEELTQRGYSPILDCQEIHAGLSNQLFHVRVNDRPDMLVKYYFSDDRMRLSRECDAFTFLHSKGIPSVPLVIFRNDELNMACYSFEAGKVKSSSELSIIDFDKILDFISALQNIPAENVDVDFPPALAASFSVKGYMDFIYQLIKRFENSTIQPEYKEKLKLITGQENLIDSIKTKIDQIVQQLPLSIFEKELPFPERRLSPSDFGPQNMLFRDDGKVCFIDFEYFGWDDPLRLASNFIVHDQTSDLSQEGINYFLAKYISQSGLSSEDVNKLNIYIRLGHLQWLVTYLNSLTDQLLSRRKFADANFSEEEYIDQQIVKIQKRLEIV